MISLFLFWYVKLKDIMMLCLSDSSLVFDMGSCWDFKVTNSFIKYFQYIFFK